MPLPPPLLPAGEPFAKTSFVARRLGGEPVSDRSDDVSERFLNDI